LQRAAAVEKYDTNLAQMAQDEKQMEEKHRQATTIQKTFALHEVIDLNSNNSFIHSFIQKFIRHHFKKSTQRRPQPNHGNTDQS